MILLTGVTGKTGGAAAKTLLSQGASFRAIVRNPDKAANLAGAGVELIVGDLTDRNVVAEASPPIHSTHGPGAYLAERVY